MVRSGQFSLAYLFFETFWISLAICFGRYFFLLGADPNVHDLRDLSGMFSIYGLLFSLSVAVGGLLNRFWGGALVGFFLVFLVAILVLISRLVPNF